MKSDCKTCGNKNNHLSFDRYGRPLIDGSPDTSIPAPKDGAMSQYENDLYEQSKPKTRQNITYREYLSGKEVHKERTKEFGENVVRSLTDDHKRINIDELVAVFNNEEIGKMSPTQALVILHELVHHKEYQKVVSEFIGLSEQVDIKYEELIKNKIITHWEPK